MSQEVLEENSDLHSRSPMRLKPSEHHALSQALKYGELDETYNQDLPPSYLYDMDSFDKQNPIANLTIGFGRNTIDRNNSGDTAEYSQVKPSEEKLRTAEPAKSLQFQHHFRMIASQEGGRGTQKALNMKKKLSRFNRASLLSNQSVKAKKSLLHGLIIR